MYRKFRDEISQLRENRQCFQQGLQLLSNVTTRCDVFPLWRSNIRHDREDRQLWSYVNNGEAGADETGMYEKVSTRTRRSRPRSASFKIRTIDDKAYCCATEAEQS